MYSVLLCLRQSSRDICSMDDLKRGSFDTIYPCSALLFPSLYAVSSFLITFSVSYGVEILFYFFIYIFLCAAHDADRLFDGPLGPPQPVNRADEFI